jgi:hypothetical protein
VDLRLGSGVAAWKKCYGYCPCGTHQFNLDESARVKMYFLEEFFFI